MTTHIDRLLRTAKAEIRAGRPQVGRAEVLAALERFPDNPRLLAQLAEAQEAVSGLPARPFVQAQLQRFLQIRSRMGLPAAVEDMAAAARLNPNSPLARNVFGGVLMEAGHLADAIPHLQTALHLDPAFREAAVNLGIALGKTGQIDRAIQVLRDLAHHSPDYLPGLEQLGPLLTQHLHHDQAIACFSHIAKLRPDDPEAVTRIALAQSAANRETAARLTLEQALLRWPDDDRIRVALGNVLLTLGDLDAAQAQFEAALRINPASGRAYYNLSRAKDFAPGDPHIAAMQRLTGAPQPPTAEVEDRVSLHFALSKALEDTGDVAGSFENLKRGNDLRASQTRYSLDQDRKLFAGFRKRFASDAGTALTAIPTTRRPIFILGMMRSGTTLLEQMLSAHPAVLGGGEMEHLGVLLSAEPQSDAPLDAAALMRIRLGYLAAIQRLPGDEPVVVDKLPGNFRWLGLIRKALPEARILHMRRDPVAVSWSNYKTLFTNLAHGYTNRLEDIIGFYDLYEETMHHWRQEYPDGFLDVDYERLTRQPEPTIRAVLEYCDLPFDPACLAPQDNKRSVQTASLRQVRQGIYTGSSSKWRGFEPFLTPLTEHFGKPPT